MAFNVNPRIGRTADGQAPRIIYGNYETNSLSFKKGEWVLCDGDAAPGTANITGVVTSGTLVLGIAMKDATNVTTGNIEIPVMEIRAGDEIYMPCVAGTTAAKSNTFYPSKNYGLYVGGNIVYANSSDTTTDCVIFKEPIYDANGDSTYWGIFQLRPASSQLGIGVT
jgi:hypothetical protein